MLGYRTAMSEREAESESVPEQNIGSHEPMLTARGGGARPLPLNSKQLSAALLRRMTKGLELPVTAALDETRVLIEGKPNEIGHPSGGVQMVLEDTERSTCIQLQDMKGRSWSSNQKRLSLLLWNLTEWEHVRRRKPGELAEALEEANRQREPLEARVRELEEALAAEKERAKELWRMSCVQVSEFDVQLKDEEIEQLRQELGHFHALSRTPSAWSTPERETNREVAATTDCALGANG